MRQDDLPPGFQAPRWLSFQTDARSAAMFAPRLFFEAHTQQFLFLPVEFTGLRSSNGGQQPLHAIARAVGIVRAKHLLMGPFIACLP